MPFAGKILNGGLSQNRVWLNVLGSRLKPDEQGSESSALSEENRDGRAAIPSNSNHGGTLGRCNEVTRWMPVFGRKIIDAARVSDRRCRGEPSRRFSRERPVPRPERKTMKVENQPLPVTSTAEAPAAFELPKSPRSRGRLIVVSNRLPFTVSFKEGSPRFRMSTGSGGDVPPPASSVVLFSTSPSLTDSEIKEIAKLARRAEKHFGRPQDVEWAITVDDGGGHTVHLLQSRPETVWSNKPRQVSDGVHTGVEGVVSNLLKPVQVKQ